PGPARRRVAHGRVWAVSSLLRTCGSVGGGCLRVAGAGRTFPLTFPPQRSEPMLVKPQRALSPHWAAARHARSTRKTDGSTPEPEQAAAPLGGLAPGQADIPVLERLAASAREGDRSAFQELVSLLQPSFWRFAYHLSGNREIAEEACQETWARVIRALPSFRAESSITTWLLAIAR